MLQATNNKMMAKLIKLSKILLCFGKLSCVAFKIHKSQLNIMQGSIINICVNKAKTEDGH